MPDRQFARPGTTATVNAAATNTNTNTNLLARVRRIICAVLLAAVVGGLVWWMSVIHNSDILGDNDADIIAKGFTWPLVCVAGVIALGVLGVYLYSQFKQHTLIVLAIGIVLGASFVLVLVLLPSAGVAGVLLGASVLAGLLLWGAAK